MSGSINLFRVSRIFLFATAFAGVTVCSFIGCSTDQVIEVDIRSAQGVVLEAFPNSIYNLTFVDSMYGMLYSNRKVYKTTNGGITWQVSYTGISNSSISKIKYVTPSQAYFIFHSSSSANGRIYSTTNGGTTWQPQFTFGNYNVCPAFYSATDGYAYGRLPTGSYGFLSTTDGGVTYTYLYACNLIGPYMQFTSPQTGYGLMDDHDFAKTLNGGQTWTSTFTGCRDFTEVTPLGTCYLINDQMRIYKSTDFGSTWSLCFDDPGVAYLRDIVCLDNGLVVVSADQKLLCSRDGGTTWKYLDLAQELQYMDEMYIVNNTTILANAQNLVVRITIPSEL